MPSVGLEPTLPCGKGILSPLCLPFHHDGGRLASSPLPPPPATPRLHSCTPGNFISRGGAELAEDQVRGRSNGFNAPTPSPAYPLTPLRIRPGRNATKYDSPAHRPGSAPSRIPTPRTGDMTCITPFSCVFVCFVGRTSQGLLNHETHERHLNGRGPTPFPSLSPSVFPVSSVVKTTQSHPTNPARPNRRG